MRLKKILLCIVLCVFVTGCANNEYKRSSKSGEVIDITLSQMETKLENGDTFAIAFVTTYCNYCMQFHSIFDEYIKNHEVTLYQVILDNEATSEEENLAIILNYFPEFYSTPGIFYVEDGKEKDYLDLYNLGISEEVIDNWVVEFKMDEEKLKNAKSLLYMKNTNVFILYIVSLSDNKFKRNQGIELISCVIERRIFMKKNSEMFFYAVSVVFLVVTVLMTINTYQTLARSAADYGATLGDEWFAVMTAIISSSFGFLGFSFMFYGIGMILGKIENQTEPKSTNQIKKRNK